LASSAAVPKTFADVFKIRSLMKHYKDEREDDEVRRNWMIILGVILGIGLLFGLLANWLASG
jgi:hypothetical protein